MQIICQNDTSDPSFLADEATAVNMLDSAFTDNITVTIQVGDGDYAGTPLPSQNVSEGDVNFGYAVTYSSLRNDLINFGQPGFFNSTNLPSGTSINGVSNFWVSSAEAKIFGIPTNGAVDGFVGIGTGFSAGAVRIAAFLHEICHALGRVPENFVGSGTTYYSALDLWRFTSTSGTRLFDGAAADHTTSWFSLDNGAHYVAYWGETSDSSDFLNDTAVVDSDPANDPFDEIVGNLGQLETADIDIMEALGFRSTAAAPPPPSPTWTQIDTISPVAMAGGDFMGSGAAQLIASYSSAGTWIHSSGGWARFDTRVANVLAAGDFSGSGHPQLAAAFSGSGLYIWGSGSGFTKIDSALPTVMTTGDIFGLGHDQLVAGYAGAGLWVWTSGFGWNRLDNRQPGLLAAGNFGIGSNTDVAAYFPGAGTYIWSSNFGWTQIDGRTSATAMAAGNFLGNADGNANHTDVAMYFQGVGTFIWSEATGWLPKIDSGGVGGLAAVDLDGNGQSELLDYAPGAGMWEWRFGSGWQRYDNTSALPANDQQALFATGHFQGGSVVDAAVTLSGSTSGVWLDPPVSSSDGGFDQNATVAQSSGMPGGADGPSIALLANHMASSFAAPGQGPGQMIGGEDPSPQIVSLAQPATS
jgi:hypothetical protein